MGTGIVGMAWTLVVVELCSCTTQATVLSLLLLMLGVVVMLGAWWVLCGSMSRVVVVSMGIAERAVLVSILWCLGMLAARMALLTLCIWVGTSCRRGRMCGGTRSRTWATTAIRVLLAESSCWCMRRRHRVT